jgi:hypothetical protein
MDIPSVGPALINVAVSSQVLWVGFIDGQYRGKISFDAILGH